jgi:uncharacterized membrane protein YwzB
MRCRENLGHCVLFQLKMSNPLILCLETILLGSISENFLVDNQAVTKKLKNILASDLEV